METTLSLLPSKKTMFRRFWPKVPVPNKTGQKEEAASMGAVTHNRFSRVCNVYSIQ